MATAFRGAESAATDALQLVAAKQLAQGHPLQAIKCLEACLRLSPMPADEAEARLRIAHLLLEHTNNLAQAKHHLQQAQMLVQKLPSHDILKCEVAALLGKAHKYCGEADFQRAAYAKGLDACERGLSGPGAADASKLPRWACYFHLRTADALASQANSTGAGAAVERGLEVAAQHGLVEEELVLRLFQLQLVMVAWDRPAAEAAIAGIGVALQRAAAAGAAGAGAGVGAAEPDGPVVRQAKLQFNILQIIYSMRLGQYDQLVTAPDDSGDAATPLAVATMEELLEAVQAGCGSGSGGDGSRADGGPSGGGAGRHAPYEWLPVEAQEGLVRLLASGILRAPGRIKPALAQAQKGLAAVDEGLRQLGIAPDGGGVGSEGGGGSGGGGSGVPLATCEQQLDHTHVGVARTMLVLRALLLESRAQLLLLQSNFAAARADVAANMSLLSRFPVLLAALRALLHMQSAQYATAVGAWGTAARHYEAAAVAATATGDPLLEPQARCLAAAARLAQGGPGAAGEAMQYMGDLYTRPSGDGEVGYAERCLAQAAGGLLRLVVAGNDPGQAAQAAEAKVLLGKALKAAHNRLHNHQLVTQVLNAMAPLRVDAADVSGATQMLTSSFTLAKGMGDLNGQIAALAALQQVYVGARQAGQAAQNANYLARKRADLAGRLADAEADAAEHAAVLGWGL